ncbi:hypothetical protein A2886_00465 [candidate division WWE3 bacterium RIFCSPHIGHO2_01_FULL_42_13]|uniref:Uncharacterized protein n=1 Tax=candidate division WWE3 bacterium RIFCSPHIGHO2_01_FULL_42_13 TaxID=1802617 RepID=A0A1F4US81_UNCKA|nr:MAG: hypothetical protein A2886_00465 [candidate division WWE3 bacterium RIFCSPHIGHO2_01_FULL_42_13]
MDDVIGIGHVWPKCVRWIVNIVGQTPFLVLPAPPKFKLVFHEPKLVSVGLFPDVETYCVYAGFFIILWSVSTNNFVSNTAGWKYAKKPQIAKRYSTTFISHFYLASLLS